VRRHACAAARALDPPGGSARASTRAAILAADQITESWPPLAGTYVVLMPGTDHIDHGQPDLIHPADRKKLRERQSSR
jgi:hypothetical protein